MASQFEFSLTRFSMKEKTQLDIIKLFVKYLDSMSARQVDSAIEACTYKKYLSQVDLINDFITKLVAENVTNDEKAEKFLKRYCNIDFNNSDTGSITGYDASRLREKSKLSILPGIIPIKRWTNPNQSKIFKIKYLDIPNKSPVNREVFYSVIEELTVLWDAYKDVTTDRYSINLKSKEFIIKGLNSTWIKYSLQLIEESLGVSFNERDEDSLRGVISTDKLWIHFVNDGGASGSPLWIKSYFNEDQNNEEIAYNQKTTDLHMYLNMFYLNDIDKTSPYGRIPGYELTLDRLIAHELTHAVLSANLDYYKELPDYISEGLAELVHGIDDIRKDAMISFIRNYPNEIKSFYLTGELSGYLSTNPFVNQFYHVSGYIILRYMAEQSARKLQDEVTEEIIIAEEIQKIIDDGLSQDEEGIIDSVLIEIPTPLYATYADAIRRVNKLMIVQAGKYEVINQIEGYSQIIVKLNNAISKVNFFVGTEKGSKIVFKQEFGLLDTVTGWVSNALSSVVSNSFNNVNPSNTGTLSGFYNPASSSLAPVVKKNSHLVGYFSDYYDSYIMNLATTSIIEFHLPSELSDSMSANFESQNVRGRSAQYHGYNDSGPRSISFSIELQADYCKEEFNITIAKLKALTYPVYTNGVIYPSCVIKLGNVLTGQFIINSVGVSYDGSQAPERDHMYTKATVSIDAVETPQIAKSAEQVERDTNYFHSDGGIKSWFQNKVIGTLKDALGLSALGL